MILHASYNKHTIMEPATLLNADYLDIIFDKRNKLYGGYELRRNYESRMRRAGTFVLLGAATLLSFSFINFHRAGILIARPNEKPIVLSKPPVVVPPPPKPVAPPPPPAAQLNTRTVTPPKIVTDDDPVETRMTPVDDMRNAHPGIANVTGDSSGIEPVIVSSGTGTGLLPAKSVSTNTPVRWVEQMPVFSGDMDKYLGAHLHYPDAAREAGIQGKVTVEFVVNEDGSVTNAKVVRSIGGGCDEEALHIVSSMPKWKPGKQNGIPVKVYFVLPINFVLN